MNDLTQTLQDINRAANSLEIFSHSAFGNASRLDDVLMMLRELEQLHANLKQAMEVQAEPTNTQSYTTLDGAIVVPPCMDWLEDGWYWECGEDFDEDGREHGENEACSRYCIGVDSNGDGISVWLNDDMQEVEV